MKFWLTITGRRCPNVWVIHGENIFGGHESRTVRCDYPRGHAGPCRNTGGLHFSSERDYSEECRSGQTGAPAKRVGGDSRLEGSNPSSSADLPLLVRSARMASSTKRPGDAPTSRAMAPKG